MKRTRDLEETVVQIVTEAKSKDDQGNPLYPEIVADPLVLAIFGAPEALFEVLKERPVRILNLLRTNHALEVFWNRFEGLWILLTDLLIERVWPMTGSVDVYPFFVIANQRIYERIVSMFSREPKPKPASAFLKAYTYFNNKLLHVNTVVGRDTNMPSRTFSLIYYDPMTKLLIDIFQHALSLSQFFAQPIEPEESLAQYIDDMALVGKFQFGGFSFPGSLGYLVALEDAFLVERKDAKTIRNELFRVSLTVNYLYQRYKSYSYEPLVTQQVKITRVNGLGETVVSSHPLRVAKSLAHLLDSIGKLRTMLERHHEGVEPLVFNEMVPVSVDADFALPYRTLLYDPEQGLFNTVEKQKEFFLSLLRKLGEITSKEEVIHKFGQDAITEPFACTVCQTETFMVDPVHHKRAFCHLSCWQHYNSSLSLL